MFIRNYWQVILLLIVGLSMRLFHLTDVSLWHDEAFSALLIKYPWSEMIYRIGLDVHPPLYYIVLRLWSFFFTDSLFSLRAFSVIFSLASIPLTYHLVLSTFKNSKAAFWSALLVAVNPFFVYYVTEARMYTFGVFLLLLSTYVLVKALNAQLESDYNLAARPIHKRYYIIFGFLSASMLYTHYYLAFSVFALGLYALIVLFLNYGLKIVNYLWLFISVTISALLFLPWLSTFLKQLNQVEGGYWIPQMDRWSIPSSLWQIFTNRPLDTSSYFSVVLGIFLVSSIIFSIVLLLRKQVAQEKILVVFLTLAPFFGSFLFYLLARLNGSDSSVFLVRYFIFTVPFILVLLSLVLTSLKKQIPGYFSLFVYSIMCVYLYSNYWAKLEVLTKPGMNGASSYINSNFSPGDAIVITSSFEFFNFKYYNKTKIEPLLYTPNTTKVESLPHYAGTAILTDQELLSSWSNIKSSSGNIWLLSTNAFGSDKPSVPQSWQQSEDLSFRDVRPYDGTVIYLARYQIK
jgi:uncharacterized membrane protein